MSRPISESLSLLSETLGNCKTNLKEKEVADVDNIKISDVDEKIAEIQAGGGLDEITNFIKFVNEAESCLVLAKSYFNSNDFVVDLTSLNYGENLSSSISYPSNYIKINMHNSFSLYIGIFPCSWKKVKFEECQDKDDDTYYGTTGEVDVSQPRVICIEMRER